MLERAIEIAVQAHRGQKDRFGAPYILHPLRVMSRVDGPVAKTVAVLHDVVEDTNWTLEDLQAKGFSAEVIEAVDCLTKREGEPYDALIQRAAGKPLARQVKLADLIDNMDLRRCPEITPKDLERLQKYLKGWRTLTGEPERSL